MHIAYEITPDTPQLPTHLSPPYSHWNSPLPPLATVWLGKENFRSSGPLKIKVRNLPTCNSFFTRRILSVRITTYLVVAGTYAKTAFYTSFALVSFFMRKHLHFLLPSEGGAKNSFFSPPPPRLFFWCCCLLLAFLGGPGGLRRRRPWQFVSSSQQPPSPFPLFPRYLLGKGKKGGAREARCQLQKIEAEIIF